MSHAAKVPGKANSISIVDASVPWDIVSHILAAIADAKLATTSVTIINMDEELRIVWIDLL